MAWPDVCPDMTSFPAVLVIWCWDMAFPPSLHICHHMHKYTQRSAFSITYNWWFSMCFWIAHTCPVHQRNWFPRSSFLQPQRTTALLWVHCCPQHISKIERHNQLVSTTKEKQHFIFLVFRVIFTWIQRVNSLRTCSTWLAFLGSWKIWGVCLFKIR